MQELTTVTRLPGYIFSACSFNYYKQLTCQLYPCKLTKVCATIVGTSNCTNNFDHWIETGIVSSSMQLSIQVSESDIEVTRSQSEDSLFAIHSCN